MTDQQPAPNPHATADEVEAAFSDTKLAQVLYHDWEAETYDEKWHISFDERCIDYARDRFEAATGGENEKPYGRALELGFGWAGFAFGGWKKLSALDEAVMRRVVPRKFFYNLAITGIKPE